jgi:hypothetical protein
VEIHDYAAIKPALRGNVTQNFPVNWHIIPYALNIDNGFVYIKTDAFVYYLYMGLGIGSAHNIDTAIYIPRSPQSLLGTEQWIASDIACGIPHAAAGDKH